MSNLLLGRFVFSPALSVRLQVAELRKELEQRGLDTTGLKAALVERLEEVRARCSADLSVCLVVQIVDRRGYIALTL